MVETIMNGSLIIKTNQDGLADYRPARGDAGP